MFQRPELSYVKVNVNALKSNCEPYNHKNTAPNMINVIPHTIIMILYFPILILFFCLAIT